MKPVYALAIAALLALSACGGGLPAEGSLQQAVVQAAIEAATVKLIAETGIAPERITELVEGVRTTVNQDEQLDTHELVNYFIEWAGRQEIPQERRAFLVALVAQVQERVDSMGVLPEGAVVPVLRVLDSIEAGARQAQP